jgi:LDH2 family malate/lactate/ureidoglycolate dehydrogenase
VAKVKQAELFACVHEILIAVGESTENAKTTAECLILSDSRGITTHGSYLLTPIVDRANAVQVSLPTKTSIVKEEAAISIVDGGNGLGPVAGKFAAELSIKQASKFGISLVLIRNTNNLGSLAYYTELIAREGMIGMMGCNAAPAMAPWGGAEAFLGTNPIAIAVYSGKDMLFSADMATSIVARGKIRKAAREGKPIPNNWALDVDGNQTTDPMAALKGALLPMGGPKGSAIALAVDIFSGILAGSMYGPNIKSFHSLEGVTGVGAVLMSIDIRKFLELDKFALMLEDYFSQLKRMKTASFASEIFLPGEIEYKKELNSQENGIALEDKAVETINELLTKFGSSRHLDSIK